MDDTPNQDQCPEGFKFDVMAGLQGQHAVTPGKVAAFNPTTFFDRVDAFAQKVGPVLAELTPAKYALLVQAVVALIHAGDGTLHPAA